jgi:hypothetical protein
LTACLGIASACGFLVVSTTTAGAATTPTTVTLPVVSAAVNEPSLMTATVAPNPSGTAQITGTVTYTVNGQPLQGGGCSGITVTAVGSGPNAEAQCNITYPATGTYTVVAAYSGDSNYGASNSGSVTEKVLEAVTVTASAPATANLNQSVTLSATVTGSHGTPTGTVDFENSAGTTLCSGTLSAQKASCATSFTSGGAHTIRADYQGNATYADSTGSNSFGSATITVPVPATTTTISAQQGQLTGLPAGVTGYAMVWTATVSSSGTPGTDLGGSVTFTKGGQAIPGCANEAVSGASPQSVSCTDSDPEDFGGPVVASYASDPHYADSTSPASTPSFIPDPTTIGTVSASPPSLIEGESVTLSDQVSAYLSPNQGPIGYIVFTSGSTRLCIAAVNSAFVGTCATSALPSGTSSVTATYVDAAGGYASATSAPFSITVGPTLYPAVGIVGTSHGGGYWIVRADGAVSAFGDAVDYGSMYGQALNKPIVGMAATPDDGGYWLVASDGGIFSFGDAQFYGSTGSITLNQPIVGMTATPDGKGYEFVAADGGVFSYGDAHFDGSMGGQALNKPVVGMAIDRTTGGYWLVASDGGIFAFDAPFLGSTGAITLNQPIVGMQAAPDGSGYRFVASDGGVFSYGLPFEGSTGGITLRQPVSGMAAGGNAGYWLVARDGGVFAFDAPFLGAAT